MVFLYAAYTKLRQPWMLFAMSIDAYQILPAWAAMLLGHWLPWLELLIGVFLVAGILLRYTAATATGLLVVFFALMARAYLNGHRLRMFRTGRSDHARYARARWRALGAFNCSDVSKHARQTDTKVSP
jgi:hypothetical protein